MSSKIHRKSYKKIKRHHELHKAHLKKKEILLLNDTQTFDFPSVQKEKIVIDVSLVGDSDIYRCSTVPTTRIQWIEKLFIQQSSLTCIYYCARKDGYRDVRFS